MLTTRAGQWPPGCFICLHHGGSAIVSTPEWAGDSISSKKGWWDCDRGVQGVLEGDNHIRHPPLETGTRITGMTCEWQSQGKSRRLRRRVSSPGQGRLRGAARPDRHLFTRPAGPDLVVCHQVIYLTWTNICYYSVVRINLKYIYFRTALKNQTDIFLRQSPSKITFLNHSLLSGHVI